MSEETKSPQLYATLVHGSTYFLGSKLFENGVKTPVTAEQKEKLEDRAVDPVDMHIGDEIEQDFRQKFEFSEGDNAPKKAVRQRKQAA